MSNCLLKQPNLSNCSFFLMSMRSSKHECVEKQGLPNKHASPPWLLQALAWFAGCSPLVHPHFLLVLAMENLHRIDLPGVLQQVQCDARCLLHLFAFHWSIHCPSTVGAVHATMGENVWPSCRALWLELSFFLQDTRECYLFLPNITVELFWRS